ncbi:hypothetical protein Hrd1104_00940 [Halorhabdus sp. CBA1104]|uniref:hypothetical protein n=1 Tax=unclassified Halorhabdus TaxID=2621901 RepID=UPI0012B1886D|nr:MULTISPECIES: hypothetical protein [unclassified Halorhabdus]QGN05994.1 hypothetical protein Hrd1104_00940 [Halorhabdus sp. CBA1104]
MSILNSFGGLVASVIAALVLLVFAVLSFFVTVFIVDVGANLAGFSPSGNFVTLSAAILSTGAIVAGASPMTGLAGE